MPGRPRDRSIGQCRGRHASARDPSCPSHEIVPPPVPCTKSCPRLSPTQKRRKIKSPTLALRTLGTRPIPHVHRSVQPQPSPTPAPQPTTSSPPIARPPAITIEKSYCNIERTYNKTKKLLQQTKKNITTMNKHLMQQIKI